MVFIFFTFVKMFYVSWASLGSLAAQPSVSVVNVIVAYILCVSGVPDISFAALSGFLLFIFAPMGRGVGVNREKSYVLSCCDV